MEQKRRTNAFVGSPVERIEDPRFLKGRGQYVDDLTREHLLHAVMLRSSVAHGRIRSVDASAALALAGVVAVITAADIGETIPTIPLRQEPVPALRGDVERAFANAPYVRRERFKVQRHAAVPMEPRGLLAEWDAGLQRLT